MIIFDSNIWIGFYNTDDTLNHRAENLFKATREPVSIPEYIFIETCSVLKQRAGKKVADTFLDHIETSENVLFLSIGEQLFFEIRNFFRQEKHAGLSFTDVSLLYLSRFYTIHTFDKKLVSAIKKAGRK